VNVRIPSRVLAATAVAAAVTLAPEAGAAPPATRVCNLLTDDRGDPTAYPTAGLPASAPGVPVPAADGDDILTTDLASDSNTVTAVIRPAALVASDPVAPFGRNYVLVFSPRASLGELFLGVRTFPTGPVFSFGYLRTNPDGTTTGVRLGDATGVVDLTRREVRISAAIRAFAPAKADLRVGRTVTGLASVIFRSATPLPNQDAPTGQRLPTGTVVGLDGAFGGSYVLGTPSCVTVGK
jgi:hypothetical protein